MDQFRPTCTILVLKLKTLETPEKFLFTRQIDPEEAQPKLMGIKLHG